MASKYRDYDKEIMSQQDYEKLQGYKQDWANATDDAGRLKANDNAEQLRAGYGYARGKDGAGFDMFGGLKGVRDDTNAQLLKWQSSQNNPTGNSDFYKQWTSLANQYMKRDPFSYDLASDGLYQQYADQYTRLGNQAMQDTLGQAAALTGGYNSSYSQGAGQQAYQGYIDQLNNIVPELYGQALNRYNQEGQDLMSAASLAGQGYSQEQTDYWNNLNYWSQQAGQEQNYNLTVDQQAQAAKQNAYSNLVTAISNTGYRPTDAELKASGMTREEADKWAAYYTRNNLGFSSGSGGGGGGGRRSGGGGGGGDVNDNDSTSPSALAGAFAASNVGTKYITSTEVQNYMRDHGFNAAQRQEFIGALVSQQGYEYSPDTERQKEYWANR